MRISFARRRLGGYKAKVGFSVAAPARMRVGGRLVSHSECAEGSEADAKRVFGMSPECRSNVADVRTPSEVSPILGWVVRDFEHPNRSVPFDDPRWRPKNVRTRPSG